MRQSTLDLMIECAVTCLTSEDRNQLRQIVRHMAQSWPNEPALALVFSITAAASGLEDVIDTDSSNKMVQSCYQLAALVAADIFAIEAMGQTPTTGQDLLHFWKRVDPCFLID